MELRDYLKIIAKRIWLLIISIVIVVLGVYFYTTNQQTNYDASADIYISIKNNTPVNTNYYQYDNYYSVQSSVLFSDTIIAWLQDPSNVMDIYNEAQISVPSVNLKDLSKLIQAKKKPGGVVEVTINSSNKDAAEAIVTKSVDFAKNKANEWTKNGQISDLFLDSSKTVVSEHRPQTVLNLMLGIVSGIILGLILVFFVEYMKKEK